MNDEDPFLDTYAALRTAICSRTKNSLWSWLDRASNAQHIAHANECAGIALVILSDLTELLEDITAPSADGALNRIHVQQNMIDSYQRDLDDVIDARTQLEQQLCRAYLRIAHLELARNGGMNNVD